jgi:hypothetical protein
MSATSKRLTALFFLLFTSTASISAQSIQFVNQPADCNLARKAYDNPFSDSHGFILGVRRLHPLCSVDPSDR